MDLLLTLLLRNLGRNPRRSALTVAAVAMPVVILVLSFTIVAQLNRFLDDSAAQLRLAVAHKTSIINPLPYGHKARIAALDPQKRDIIAVVGIAWIGGVLANDREPLTTMGVDADEFPIAFTDHLLTQQERDAWQRDRRALIVGRSTAAKMGWKVGDRVTIRASIPPYSEFSFNVISTAPKAIDPVANWCHLSYVFEERARSGLPESSVDLVSFLFVKCSGRAALERYRVEIDRLFENTPDETQTQDEKAFLNQFISQQFDLPTNLTLLALITIAVAVLAAANTMNMSFRDRIGEAATLRALGFSARFGAWLSLTESVLLCGIGGCVGVLAPVIAFGYTPIGDVQIPLIVRLEIGPGVCVVALTLALAIGAIAGAWPAIQGGRLRVIDALRSLE